VILKATSFLEGHKRDMGMTCSITPLPITWIFNWSGKKKIQNFKQCPFELYSINNHYLI
jgi:hypothetical protein